MATPAQTTCPEMHTIEFYTSMCKCLLYMDLYIPPYRINNEKIFTPTKEAVLKQPRTVKAEQ